MSKTPTLEDAIIRLRRVAGYRGTVAIRELCRRIAAGERNPVDEPLPPNVIQFACQYMVILIDHAVSLPSTVATKDRWCPDECPITLLPFFMWIEHPTRGQVPTYGGPYDSYTIPEPDTGFMLPGSPREDIEYTRERYDHDIGGWVDGVEVVEFRVTTEERLIDLGMWDEDDHEQ